MGVQEGDMLMVHSAWRADSGFRGTPQQLVQAFIDSVGPTGTLCMMSMPFHGMSAAEYLKKGKIFDVRKTVSMVGLPSEIFRRRKDVIRSLHPTHSVTACGPKAKWLIEGHEKCLSPFGKDSPFDKMVQVDGKILMYDVPFNTMTFEHYLEDSFQDQLHFNLYEEKPIEVECINHNGRVVKVNTLVLLEGNNKLRNNSKLFEILKKNRSIKASTLRRVSLQQVDMRKAVDAGKHNEIAKCY